MWRPKMLTLLFCRVAGDAGDGYYFWHDGVMYGPWIGFREDGAEWDIWDVHEWALEHLGVCPFPMKPCDESHHRPEWAEKRRAEQIKNGVQLSFA